jgi:hypothetical protein
MQESKKKLAMIFKKPHACYHSGPHSHYYRFEESPKGRGFWWIYASGE